MKKSRKVKQTKKWLKSRRKIQKYWKCATMRRDIEGGLVSEVQYLIDKSFWLREQWKLREENDERNNARKSPKAEGHASSD